VALVDCHRVPEKAVPGGPAAGGDRGRAGAGRRRKDAAMGGEPRRAVFQLGEERRAGGIDQIGAQAVTDHDDDPSFPLHGTTPFNAKSKISKLRSLRDSVIARYSAVSGRDSRNGTRCSKAP